MSTKALFIACYVLRWETKKKYILSATTHCCQFMKPAVTSWQNWGLLKKNENGQGCSCLKAEREKKPPAERGDLSTFNEEHGSQAVFLQSAPLVSQQDSQHDTKYIKV